MNCSKTGEKPWPSPAENTGRSSPSRNDRWMWQELPSRASYFAMKVRL